MIDRVKDPVCRMEIRLDQAVEATLFEGAWVHFCSQTCYGAFLDTPHRYRGWSTARGSRHALWFNPRWRHPVGAGAVARQADKAKIAFVDEVSQVPATLP